MKTFLFIEAYEAGEGYVPSVHSVGTAKDINAMIAQWVEPTAGCVPDHTENIQDDFDEDVTDTEIKAEAIRRTKERFGIGCEKSDEYSDEYMIIEVDLATGEVTTYPS